LYSIRIKNLYPSDLLFLCDISTATARIYASTACDAVYYYLTAPRRVVYIPKQAIEHDKHGSREFNQILLNNDNDNFINKRIRRA